jgi:hypothetical protein
MASQKVFIAISRIYIIGLGLLDVFQDTQNMNYTLKIIKQTNLQTIMYHIKTSIIKVD